MMHYAESLKVEGLMLQFTWYNHTKDWQEWISGIYGGGGGDKVWLAQKADKLTAMCEPTA
jgi:hypothetical protein